MRSNIVELVSIDGGIGHRPGRKEFPLAHFRFRFRNGLYAFSVWVFSRIASALTWCGRLRFGRGQCWRALACIGFSVVVNHKLKIKTEMGVYASSCSEFDPSMGRIMLSMKAISSDVRLYFL